MNFYDPDGRDIYIFDANGSYIETIKECQEDYIQWNRGKDDVMKISFADPNSDSRRINENTKLICLNENQIREIINGQGGFTSSISDFVKESVGGGNFDYSVSVLSGYSNGAQEYSSKGNRESSGSELISPILFIPEGQNVAHNLMNFGNFLWGATGASLGVKPMILKMGAHANSLLNSTKNGYRPQFDSSDDQRSITLGIDYAKQHHYAK